MALSLIDVFIEWSLCCTQVVSSAIVDKYIGESARLIREMFNYARDHQPCIIFMDEIDAIGKVLLGYYFYTISVFPLCNYNDCISYKLENVISKYFSLSIYFWHNGFVIQGGRRFSEGTSADREIQRTLMELLNQMDGFDSLGQVKPFSVLWSGSNLQIQNQEEKKILSFANNLLNIYIPWCFNLCTSTNINSFLLTR